MSGAAHALPLCIDCNWHVKTKAAHWCKRPQPDLVTGEEQVSLSEAHWERSAGACGPTAVYFNPRHPPRGQ